MDLSIQDAKAQYAAQRMAKFWAQTGLARKFRGFIQILVIWNPPKKEKTSTIGGVSETTLFLLVYKHKYL